MTDNDRMDRAKRIRQMREGSRDSGADSPSETDDERADGGPETQTMEDIAETSTENTKQEVNAAGESDRTTETPAAKNETVSAATGDAGSTGTDGAPKNGGDTASENGGKSGSDPTATSGEKTGSDPTATPDKEASSDDSVSAPLPEMDDLEAALDGTETTAQPETAGPTLSEGGAGTAAAGSAGAAATQTTEAAVAEEAEPTQEKETRVLEFTLDDEHYCLDIEYIEEIVKHENITRVPNTPAHVEGVVDLRGQITTILNPKVTIGKENDEAGELIVVFDSEAFEDQGHIGWIVDDVRQVSPIVESEVNDPPMADEHINGVIDREDDDEFVIWTSPELAFEDDD